MITFLLKIYVYLFSDSISKAFSSLWQEDNAQTSGPNSTLSPSQNPPEPQFTLPSCYHVNVVGPQTEKLNAFSEETLFYIFYTMPRDTMQEAAAVELQNRNWRFHKELKLWLTKDPTSEPVQQSNQAERGVYIFFDPVNWEKVKKQYYLIYSSIA